VNQIADVVAVAFIPNAWYFLWSPVVDLGMLRRHWILLAASVSGLACTVAIGWPPASLAALTALLFAANGISMLLSSACGAVLTAIQPAARGRASGWYQAGNLGAATLGGGATIWLAGFIGPKALAALCVALVVLPALAALRLYEEPAHGLKAGALFRALARDLWDVLKARRTWAGLAFFLSPVGANALTNLISSICSDYRASAG
jgi:MFS transporter, PAT family, beta-lactamase induction signal transducer AmpG